MISRDYTNLDAVKEEELCQESLEIAYYNITQRHPFLGYILYNLERQINTRLPTAGMMPIRNNYMMIVNPFFFNSMKRKEQQAIILHELYHALNTHFVRRKERDHKLFNVAADLAINVFIKDLPKVNKESYREFLLKQNPEQAEEINKYIDTFKTESLDMGLLPSNYNLPNDKTAEWYYDKIQSDKDLKEKFKGKSYKLTNGKLTNEDGEPLSPEELEQLKKDIKDGKVKLEELDSHEWDSEDGSDPALIDESLKGVIQEAMARHSPDFGNLPGSMQAHIREFLDSTVNWKAVLRAFVQNATIVLKERSSKRRNRRYGITYPGTKTEFKLNLAVLFDVSGSVSDRELAAACGELNRILSTTNTALRFIAADTEITHDYVVKKKLDPQTVKFKGRGGTCATTWVNYLNKVKADACIVFTDGEFESKIPKRDVPTLWVITPGRHMEIKDLKQTVGKDLCIKMKLKKEYK